MRILWFFDSLRGISIFRHVVGEGWGISFFEKFNFLNFVHEC